MSNAIPYAEDILNSRMKNQWFVQFFKDVDGNYDENAKINHFNWFTSNLVTVREVTSLAAPQENTGFYHVNFVDESDPRLHMYQKIFEDETGASLAPNSYQMYEWDYTTWVERGGPLEFAEFMSNKPR